MELEAAKKALVVKVATVVTVAGRNQAARKANHTSSLTVQMVSRVTSPTAAPLERLLVVAIIKLGRGGMVVRRFIRRWKQETVGTAF